MLKETLLFSWTNLIHKKVRSWLTLIGILIGVTAVVALVGLGNGLKLAVSSQFGISSTEVISVQAGGLSAYGPPGSGVTNPLTTKDVDDIKKISYVEFAVPRIIESGPTEFGKEGGFGFAMNFPDGDDRKFAYDALEFKAEQGRLLKDGDNGKIILGHNYGTDVNDFKKIVRVGDKIKFKGQDFEVIGILKKKGSFIFDNIIAMNTDDLTPLIENKDRVDVIAVKVKNEGVINQAKEEIEKVLRKNRDVKVGEEDFEVQTPQAVLSTVNSVLTGVQIFIVMIAAISMIVGALGIVNTMMTAVMERKNQIGIMKAIGAKNSDIFLQFFIESGLMGLLGGIVGVTLGTVISYFGTLGLGDFLGAEITPSIDITFIILVLVGTFIIGSVAGIAPAMKAARQKPVDAIRG